MIGPRKQINSISTLVEEATQAAAQKQQMLNQHSQSQSAPQQQQFYNMQQ